MTTNSDNTKFSRTWAMPDSNTFNIKPIKELLNRYIKEGMVVIDPFARNNKFGTITNDLNPKTEAQYHMDAIEFCQMLVDQKIQADIILFDPPYSPRQISECYQSIDKKCTKEDTQIAKLWKECKSRLIEVLKPNGITISFGWNTVGFTQERCDFVEIMLVSHGGAHNDSIVTVQKKIK